MKDRDVEWLIALKTWCVVFCLISVCAAIGFAMVMLLPRPSWATGPAEKWGHDPETSKWFRNLHSQQGFPCCDYADGARVEAPDYRENDDGTYEVLARGRWVHIPKEKLVTIPNRVGYAILWWGVGAPEPYCFMPGARV